MVNTTLLIFIGARLGGVFRYWITQAIHILFSRDFPYGTMIVNPRKSVESLKKFFYV